MKGRLHGAVFHGIAFWALALFAGPAHAGLQGRNEEGYFIENRGQWPAEVYYLTNCNGLNAWITNRGIVYDFYQATPVREQLVPLTVGRAPEPTSYAVKGQVIRFELEGASTLPHPQQGEKLPTYYNYFLGNDPDKWASRVPLYKEVTLNEVYPGIGIRHYFDNGTLRYDFVVAPGADPSQIRFHVRGAHHVEINDAGELVFRTRFGEVRHAQLKAYQKAGDEIVAVACAMKEVNENVISFTLGAYDPSRPLIIDPALNYSTLIGGGGDDRGYVLLLDNYRQSYIVGRSYSANYPTTTGAYDTTHNGGMDVVVSKLNATGSQLIFSTFIGGSGNEDGYSIRLSHDNRYVVVAGGTYSNNFPVTSGAYDTTPNGSADAFILKMDSSGSNLIWSSYLGGGAYDWGYSIYMDPKGKIHVTGYTTSYNFPTTLGAYDPTYNGSGDVFVVQLDSSASTLDYSTYLGGNNQEWGHFIQMDAAGKVYITGGSRSGNYPTTSGAYDISHNGNMDVIVSVLDSSGSNLVYSTYLGGSGFDWGAKLKRNKAGNIYLTGETRSSNFPYTSGVFDSTLGGGKDAFLAKLSPTLDSLLVSTFVGGGGDDQAFSLEFDSKEEIYLSGETYSTDFPTTAGAYDTTHNGGADGYILKMDSAATAVLYSTYLGGSGNETAHSLSVDSNDYLYLGGKTTSSDFPTTSGAYDTTHNGNYDIFITRWSEKRLPVELVRFEARGQNGQVVLKWTTASEKNSLHFVVERSADGRQFNPIGQVEAAGHSLRMRHYRFTDKAPLRGVSYYRLRQVDYDGSETLSPIEMVILHAEDAFVLKPSVTRTWVRLSGLPSGIVSMSVMNSMGQKVWETSVSGVRTERKIWVGDLPTGRYVVRLVAANGRYIEQPFLKQ